MSQYIIPSALTALAAAWVGWLGYQSKRKEQPHTQFVDLQTENSRLSKRLDESEARAETNHEQILDLYKQVDMWARGVYALIGQLRDAGIDPVWTPGQKLGVAAQTERISYRQFKENPDAD